jgi:hypothetical protein
VPQGGSHKFKVEYYENMAESPTRTRDIVVADQTISGSKYELTYPAKGSYGQNIQADMSIVFNNSGIGSLFKRDSSKILQIK